MERVVDYIIYCIARERMEDSFPSSFYDAFQTFLTVVIIVIIKVYTF